MPNTTIHCDIFCAVVDNYGDAGVAWRLARQLAAEHGWQVRLWIDDPTPLARLAPGHDARPVEVRLWSADFPLVDSADVVIETFACDLPPRYLEAMARHARAPVWINLDYLSAENWVADCHGLPSPHPHLPLIKHFFFPGFVAQTGGLLRERDYDIRRQEFDAAAFRAEFNLPPKAPRELTLSLFSYPNAALPHLIDSLAAAGRPIRLLRPDDSSVPSSHGDLSIHPLPFLPQMRYDELLWACDVNFVRGEDSFVRAQWAGKPFVWHIYPQADNAHRMKLDAFLGLYAKVDADETVVAALGNFWQAWNGEGILDWNEFAGVLPDLDKVARSWSARLASRPDLATNLVQFCCERLK